MREFIKNFGQCIKIYVGKEVITDPYDKTVETQIQAPVSIQAIVTDLVFSQITWKLPGIKATQAKEILVEKEQLPLLLLSQKIGIDQDLYTGWRANQKLQYRTEGDFIRLYVYTE